MTHRKAGERWTDMLRCLFSNLQEIQFIYKSNQKGISKEEMDSHESIFYIPEDVKNTCWHISQKKHQINNSYNY